MEHMTDIERLLAIEEIKNIKGKYFYYLDHKDWEGWKKEVFAPDASLHVPEHRPEPWVGIDKIIEYVSAATGKQVSVHHGHMPIIEISSENSAKAIWAMEDILRRDEKHPAPGFNFLHGYGHYHETYVRNANGWRIKTTRLSRLYVERHDGDSGLSRNLAL
jgi:SnoaL-like domain